MTKSRHVDLQWGVLAAVFLVSFLWASSAHADDRFWVEENGSWNTTDNWGSVSGGASGASVPVAGDIAIFDSNSKGATVTVDVNVSINGLRLSEFTGRVNQGANTFTVGTGNVIIGSGRFISSNSSAFALSGSYTQTGGIVELHTFTLSGSLSVTDPTTANPSPSFTSTGTVTFDGNADQNLIQGNGLTLSLENITLNNATGGANDDLIVNMSGGLVMSGVLTVTLGNVDLDTYNSALSLSGDLIFGNSAQATLVSDAAVTMSGNLTVRPNAGFTMSGTNTVTLDGVNQTLSGSMTFVNFTKTVTVADTLTFLDGSTTVTITSTTTLNGSAGALLSLRSTTTNTQWRIDPQGTDSLTFLDVRDSNNVNATAASCSSGCQNAKNNTNWTFTGTGGIKGNVFYESGGTDGVFDDGTDSGVVGSTVTLSGAQLGSNLTATPSATNGYFSFGSLLSGTYVITVSVPSGVSAHSVTPLSSGHRTTQTGAGFSFTADFAYDTASSTAEQSAAISGGGSKRGGGGGGGRGAFAYITAPSAQVSVQAPPQAAIPEGAAFPSRRGKLEVVVAGKSLVFRDVPVSEWFAPHVAAIIGAGFASGYKDAQGRLTGEFGPANPVTYAEIAKMASEAVGLGEYEAPPRNRSAQGQWSAGYIAMLELLGISVFSDTALDVNTPAPRGAVVQTLLEVFGVPIEDATGDLYSDVAAGRKHSAAIETATSDGIVSGDDDKVTFRPGANVNRAETAKMVMNAVGTYGQ